MLVCFELLQSLGCWISYFSELYVVVSAFLKLQHKVMRTLFVMLSTVGDADFVVMLRCQGLLDGPCPEQWCDNTV